MMWKKREIVSDPEAKKAYHNFNEKMKKGDGLHFNLTIDENGWFAQCKEYPGIITGGDKLKPSESEIMESIVGAIKVAFSLPDQKEESKEFRVRTTGILHKEERQIEVCV